MSRPRKPTAVLEASGAFEKNPQRKRERENEVRGTGSIGDPPDYFSPVQRAVWRELVAQSTPGVLFRSDRSILELTVLSLCKMRASPVVTPQWLKELGKRLERLGWEPAEVRDFEQTVFQALRITPAEMKVLASCLATMGMTPADRLVGWNAGS